MSDTPCTCQPDKIDPHCKVHGLPKKIPILDMFNLTEDQRIDRIVQILVSNPGKAGAIMVELEKNDSKIRRYMAKVKSKLPTVIYGPIVKGPVKGVCFCSATYPEPIKN